MALGGIGSGGFEIRQDGGFANWSIFNNWPLFPGKRYPFNAKQALFFMLWVREENENPRLVLLQIEDSHGSAAIDGHEFQYTFPWISGVDVNPQLEGDTRHSKALEGSATAGRPSK